jgi:DNA-binding CsgD family transcriptional regulator
VNACFVTYIFFSLQMMQSFGGYRIPKGNSLLIAAGAFYVAAYSLSYKATLNEAQHIPLKLSLIIFIISELLLIGVILVCCSKLLIHWAGSHNAIGSRLLIPVFAIGTIAYTLFNAYVDICFYFFEDRTSIWGINIYNLSVIYYIVINLVSLPLVYSRKTFLKNLLEKGEASTLAGQVVIDNSPVTLADSAKKYHLSARETEVLDLLCRGKSNPDISCALFISNNTVKHHVNSIYKKTGVKNRYELLSILKSQ